MADTSQTRLIGMAMARGLIDLGDVSQMLGGTPESEDAILQGLLAQGTLDATDLAILGQLIEQSSARICQGPGVHCHHRGEIRIASGEAHPVVPETCATGDARDVLSLAELQAWKQFRDLRLIGEGGMGRIFKAEDPGLKRSVALKFLRRGESELVKRFMLEAQYQAMLDHPNVCKVYEVGEWGGQAYIAMQFIQGQTLEQMGAVLKLSQIIAVMECVAEAVHAAHRLGLIHRDLKPANIMVEKREGAVLKPYVLDFGLARGQERSGITTHGEAFGTRGYMAPEQLRGESEKIGACTDVYALGATLYKLLTGQAPFSESAAQHGAPDQDPVPLRSIKPDLPIDLERLVRKCMEPEPQHRYASAEALAEDLRRFRNGNPIQASITSRWHRVGRSLRRNRRLLALTAALTVMLAGVAAWETYHWVTDSVRSEWAQQYGLEAERIEASIRYAHLKPPHDIRPELEQVRTRLQAMEQRPYGRFEAGPAAYAIGRGYLALGEPDKARKWLELAQKHGFRSIEVSYALGRAMGQIYERELHRASLIQDPQQQAEQQRLLQDRYLGPALQHLRAGRGSTPEPAAYHQALMAYYEGNYPQALEQAQQAYQEVGWFYEAKKLEGEVLLAMARQPEHAGSVASLRDTAAARFQEAQSVAPSDPSLYLKAIQATSDPRPGSTEGTSSGAVAGMDDRQRQALLDQLAKIRAIRPDLAEMLASLTRDLSSPAHGSMEVSLDQLLGRIRSPRLDADGLPATGDE